MNLTDIQSEKKIVKKVKQLQNSPYRQDLELLGEGKFGKVYRCYNEMDKNEQLVVKVIKRQQSSEVTIEQELQVLTNVMHHQNLVNYKKIKVESQNNVYLIMEYCNQGNLQEYLKNMRSNQISEKQLKQFIFQFVQGYQQLKKAKIAHRDIKLENIMLHNSNLKIADFGLSFLYDTENAQNTKLDFLNSRSIGTVLTMAPELYGINKKLPKNTDLSIVDVFSFGVVLFQLAYYSKNEKKGPNEFQYTHPYIPKKSQIQDIPTFQKMVMSQQYPNFKEQQITRSSDLKRFIQGCLEIDPDKRYTWDQIFKDPFINEIALMDLSQSKLLSKIKDMNKRVSLKANFDMLAIDFQVEQVSKVLCKKVQMEKVEEEENPIKTEDFEFIQSFADQKNLMIEEFVKFKREQLYTFDRINNQLMYLVLSLKSMSEEIDKKVKQLEYLKLVDKQKSTFFQMLNPYNLFTSSYRKEKIQELNYQVEDLQSIEVQIEKSNDQQKNIALLQYKKKDQQQQQQQQNQQNQQQQENNNNNDNNNQLLYSTNEWFQQYQEQIRFFNDITSLIFYLMKYSQIQTVDLQNNIETYIKEHFQYYEMKQNMLKPSENPQVFVDEQFLESYFKNNNINYKIVQNILEKDSESFVFSQKMFIEQLTQNYYQQQEEKQKQDKKIQIDAANIILQNLQFMTQDDIKIALLEKCKDFIKNHFGFTNNLKNYQNDTFGNKEDECFKNALITFKYLFELEELLEQGNDHKFLNKEGSFYNDCKSIQNYFEEIENWDEKDLMNNEIIQKLKQRKVDLEVYDGFQLIL